MWGWFCFFLKPRGGLRFIWGWFRVYLQSFWGRVVVFSHTICEYNAVQTKSSECADTKYLHMYSYYTYIYIHITTSHIRFAITPPSRPVIRWFAHFYSDERCRSILSSQDDYAHTWAATWCGHVGGISWLTVSIKHWGGTTIRTCDPTGSLVSPPMMMESKPDSP